RRAPRRRRPPPSCVCRSLGSFFDVLGLPVHEPLARLVGGRSEVELEGEAHLAAEAAPGNDGLDRAQCLLRTPCGARRRVGRSAARPAPLPSPRPGLRFLLPPRRPPRPPPRPPAARRAG